MAENDRPTYTVIAGPNGAGKSTLVNGLHRAGYDTGPFVNPDVIAKSIHERAKTEPEDIILTGYGEWVSDDTGTREIRTVSGSIDGHKGHISGIEVSNNGGESTSYWDKQGPLYQTARLANQEASKIALRYERNDDSPVIPERGNIDIAAGREALRQTKENIASGTTFSRESTLSSREIIRSIENAKDAGFEVNVLFVAVQNRELASDRVADRVEKGGHDIPIEAQERRFERTLENASKAATLADKTYFFDNSTAQRHTLVAEAENGRLTRIQTPTPNWVKEATQGLPREQTQEQPGERAPITTADAAKQIAAAEKAVSAIEDPARKAVAHVQIDAMRKAAGLPQQQQQQAGNGPSIGTPSKGSEQER